MATKIVALGNMEQLRSLAKTENETRPVVPVNSMISSRTWLAKFHDAVPGTPSRV